MNIYYKLFLNSFWILIFLVSNGIAVGQTETKVGVKLGFNLAKQYLSPDPQYALTLTKAGIYIGIPIEIPLSKLFAVQIEPSFISKGLLYAVNPGYYSSVSINYFEVPVFLKFNKGDNFQFNIIAGPSAAVAVGGKINQPVTSQLINFDNGNYSRYDVCLNAGAGIKIPLKKKFIIIDTRYSYGVYNISAKSTAKIMNRGIIITLGLLF